MLSLNKNWSSLIRPTKILSEIDNETPNKAKFNIEPLERGFGLTIANALRRVLLSSLQGAAITTFKIPNILHEFSNIPGVTEDLVDIILNLKSIVLRLHSSEKKVIRLNVMGPCAVTAGMIELGHDVEILNPDLVLFNITQETQIQMEMTVESGKGYVPAISARDQELPVGVIPIDAIYSPVKKVSYKIDNARVGQDTDYDKLTMAVETNGSVKPELAVALAARILQDQLQNFITFDESDEDAAEEVETLPFDKSLLKKVDELELSVRSQNCLKNDNIVYLGDLVVKSETEMLKTPNFGRKSLNEIKDVLTAYNLKFGMNIDSWPPENVEELAKKYEDPF